MNILITQNQPILEIHTQKGLKLISLNKILYIKAFKKGSVIYLDNLESVDTHYLLKSYDRYLPIPFFFRCHNSYLINCGFVNCFCGTEIILKENVRIPLSRNKRRPVKENLIEMQQSS